MKRTSKLYKLLRKIDTFLYIYGGYIPDFERLDFVHEQRPLFSIDGLIKVHLSMIPWSEHALKAVVKQLGGWEMLMKTNFVITEEGYARLERAGLSREQLNKSRQYNSNPEGYRRNALNNSRPKSDH